MPCRKKQQKKYRNQHWFCPFLSLEPGYVLLTKSSTNTALLWKGTVNSLLQSELSTYGTLPMGDSLSHKVASTSTSDWRPFRRRRAAAGRWSWNRRGPGTRVRRRARTGGWPRAASSWARSAWAAPRRARRRGCSRWGWTGRARTGSAIARARGPGSPGRWPPGSAAAPPRPAPPPEPPAAVAPRSASSSY